MKNYTYYNVEIKSDSLWVIHPLANRIASLPDAKLFKAKAKKSRMNARVIKITIMRKVVSR
jgi:hypothetical protein